MTTSEHESHTLAGPYAMDAVSDDERASFAAHLSDCEQCQEDVSEMREATARLGLAAAVTPRPELREQTIRAAFATTQLAPVVSDPGQSRPGLLAEEKKDKSLRRTGVPAAEAGWRRRLGRVRSARLPVRISLAAAAVLAVTAAVLGGMTSNAMRQLDHSRRQEHMIAAVLNAPDKVMLTARVMTGGTATVVMSRQARAAVFTAHDLVSLPSTEGYEIWLMGPTGERAAGMLRPQAGGMAGPEIVFGLRPGDVIAVTVEPADGASRPTSVLVVVFKPGQ
jgi:hypothetical protein